MTAAIAILSSMENDCWGDCTKLSAIKPASNRPILLNDQQARVTGVKTGIQAQRNKVASLEVRQPEWVRDGNLVYLSASSRLVCQLEASRRELDRLERHANRMLRSVGEY